MSFAATPQQPSTAWRYWATTLGVLAVAAQLYLVWGFDFFPTVDGPAHTHLAHAMYEALQGDAFYGALVEFNSKLNPNLTTQALLVALMAIAPPLVAEKLLLTLYFASFVCAAAYALAGINRKSLCLLPLLVFCSISLPLAFGFYNFSFSTVVFLAWFGYWWRHRHTLGLATIVGHALFAAVAYTTHIFAFVVSVFAIAVAGATSIFSAALRSRRAGAGNPPFAVGRSFVTHALPPFLGSLPELAACLHFLLGRFGEHTVAGAAAVGASPLLPRLQQFLASSSLAPYDNSEFMVTAMIAPICLATAMLLAFKSRGRSDGHAIVFGALFVAFLTLYLLMPPQWLVRWMPPRFQPLVLVTLLLWLAALIPASIKPAHWKAIGVAGLALVVLSVAARAPVFSTLNGYYRELASTAPHIRENSRLIALRLHGSPAKLDVLIQAGSRIADLRHSVDLKNFQGQSEDHPIQFRAGVGAAKALGGDAAIISLSPQIDLMAYERQTGAPIDYVIVQGFPGAAFNQAGLARLEAQLREHYLLVYASRPRGFARLYVRNPDAQAARGSTSPL